MKKSKKALTVTAAVVAAALGTTACTFPGQQPQAVYGPPIEEEYEKEEIQDVYGPPVEEDEIEINTSYTVYGPPSDADMEAVTVEVVYGPPETMGNGATDFSKLEEIIK